MGNYYIDKTCLAFLDSSNNLGSDENQINFERVQELEDEINRRSLEWKSNTIIAFEKEAFQLFRFARKQIQKQKNSLKPIKENENSLDDEEEADEENNSRRSTKAYPKKTSSETSVNSDELDHVKS
mmetsp:Transcript_12401/g.19365  ORF Transcript_12401/g.19365 Transcript_12401/m.19365 type:complete len:126 (+) Transcript_12401:337-714(+)